MAHRESSWSQTCSERSGRSTPATGATLPGYPIQIHDSALGITLAKSGAAAEDEPLLEFCGDETVNGNETCDPPGSAQTNGQICRQDCSYCGDGVIQSELGEQCDPPNTATCDANCNSFEICLDLIDDDLDGAIDCLDADCDCLPIGRDPGAIRFGRRGQGDLLAVHGSLAPTTAITPSTEEIKILLTNANGIVHTLVIPAGDVKQLSRNLFGFRNKFAQRNRTGLARFDVRFFPNRNNYTFVLKTYGDLSKATLAQMGFQISIGDDGFLNQSTWQTTPKGWVLRLPGE